MVCCAGFQISIRTLQAETFYLISDPLSTSSADELLLTIGWTDSLDVFPIIAPFVDIGRRRTDVIFEHVTQVPFNPSPGTPSVNI